MKFLYIYALGKGPAGRDIMRALRKAGHETDEYPSAMMLPTYLNDDNMKELETYIHENDID